MTEREIINLFLAAGGPGNSELVQGIGDDCAVLRPHGEKLSLVTTDTLIESVHFNLDWHPPDKLGWKSLAVNVSDIAAMGGSPAFVFLSLGLPRNFDSGWLEKFARGLADSCRHYDCRLAGGDTVESPGKIMITLTVIGHAAPDKILYRRNARDGDEVWVSGTLGNAAAGLELCRAGRIGDGEAASLVESHLNPKPRVELASRLAASGLVHAMMDLSDGLATDLAHLCTQSMAGAVIYADLLPISPLLRNTAEEMGKDVLQWALAGGEDYELLFTAPARHRKQIMRLAEGEQLTGIGSIDTTSGVRLARGRPGQKVLPVSDISFLGYEHFKA